MSINYSKIDFYKYRNKFSTKKLKSIKYYCQLQKTRQKFHNNCNPLSKSQDCSKYYQNKTPNITKKLSINYYKNPFTLNDNKLNTHFNLLKSQDDKLSNEVSTQTSLNETNILPNINFHIKNFNNTPKKENNCRYKEMQFYKTVFKCESAFKKPKSIVIDNKLNMRYAENEKQYIQIIDNENKKLKSLGKPIKLKNNYIFINSTINEVKNKIQFMKDIVDYSYPSFIVKKINIMERKNNDNLPDLIYSELTPVEKRNKEGSIKNELRQKYLMDCIQCLKK